VRGERVAKTLRTHASGDGPATITAELHCLAKTFK
jgi:hypothetical protein